ncbi:MAG: twin-arginine translocation signal domain-containing protein [Alphaproteobacteria bacterium]|nr:twin-arginine translocation signal domain-containing protein [Alphaproteobacteria bacterium]
MSSLHRRRFLQTSAALGGVLASSSIGRAAPANRSRTSTGTSRPPASGSATEGWS